MPRVTSSRTRPRRPVRRLLATAIGALLVASGLASPAAAAEAEIAVAASAPVVDLDEPVTIAGTLLGADDACVATRALRLEWRRADGSGFAPVEEGASAADGSFSFEHAEPYSGRYRVTAPADAACAEAVSTAVSVGVRARVDAAVLDASVTAGSCTAIAVSVTPPRPGQVVDLQRREAGSWSTTQTLTLDAASAATVEPCFGWEDAGPVRLRARWRAQDALNETAAGAVLSLRVELADWMARIEEVVGRRDVSVSVGGDGAFLFGIEPAAPRIPASNEKLLLSMAMLARLGPSFRMRTIVAADGPVGRVVRGDVWLLGRGDPEVGRRTILSLARRVAAAGVERIRGRVLGSTAYFRRDWDAPGWNDRARDYVARPTALVFDGNVDERGNVRAPELRAAAALERELERLGVMVVGRPGSGRPPDGLTPIARAASRTLRALLAKTLRPSDNFYAEVLGKRLGVATTGPPGTIASAASAIRAFALANGVEVDVHDSSGLSYANRVTTEGVVRLLWAAEDAPWGADLLEVLPTGGQGTLRHRLADVRVRAKTGTLTEVSALSGWVWLERLGTWAAFSILSQGMSKAVASDLEDAIVRILQERAAPAA